jgi:MFS transporter, DHA1 family, multidrug resistance protein
VLYSTFWLYVAFNHLCAFAPNFSLLLVGRFLTGTFASAPLSIVPGVIADIWEPRARGNAMGVFVMMTFTGPVLAPVISGFLQLNYNWRWSFYVLLWMGGLSGILMLTVPETHPAAILRNKARHVRKTPGFENFRAPGETQDRKLVNILKIAFVRPWQILFDLIAFFIAIYLSIVYALLYMLFIIYPIVFQQNRSWNSGVGQLPLLGTAIGAVIGGSLNFLVSNKTPGQARRAEDRLPLAMAGGLLLPIAVFWFSWTANYTSVHWVVPTLAGVVLGISIFLIMASCLNYLTDTYLIYTASAMAANQICRSACAASVPLYTQIMFDKLGVGVAGSVIGGVAALLVPIPFVFYFYGESIRKRSKFAPTSTSRKTSEDEEQDSQSTNEDVEAKEQQEEAGNPSCASNDENSETLQNTDSTCTRFPSLVGLNVTSYNGASCG